MDMMVVMMAALMACLTVLRDLKRVVSRAVQKVEMMAAKTVVLMEAKWAEYLVVLKVGLMAS